MDKLPDTDPVIRDLHQHFADIDYQDDVDRHIEWLEKWEPESIEGLTGHALFDYAEQDMKERQLEAEINRYED